MFSTRRKGYRQTPNQALQRTSATAVSCWWFGGSFSTAGGAELSRKYILLASLVGAPTEARANSPDAAPQLPLVSKAPTF